MLKVYAGRTTDGRTDDRRQVMTKAHMAFGQVSLKCFKIHTAIRPDIDGKYYVTNRKCVMTFFVIGYTSLSR